VQARRRFGSLYEPILHCVKDPARYTFNADEIRVEAPTGARRRLIDYRKPVPALYSSDKVPGNVWYFPRVRYRMPEYEEHPTQKPEALLARIIAASSRPGELVLDLFAGSFTASAVAQRLGRRSVAVELEPDYIAIGLRRLGLATASAAAACARPSAPACDRRLAQASASLARAGPSGRADSWMSFHRSPRSSSTAGASRRR
jgi:adenine-specific DNA-methyltransferase